MGKRNTTTQELLTMKKQPFQDLREVICGITKSDAGLPVNKEMAKRVIAGLYTETKAPGR